MRFLALQTDIEVLKKQYIPEGEHEIMTVRRHVVLFVLGFLWKTATALALVIGLVVGLRPLESADNFLVFIGLLFLLVLCYIYQIINSYIAWRFNFLIVTSDKIIIINHRSFLHQKMNSIHLDAVTSSKFESQYFGLVRCGVLHIHLEEKEGQGSTRVITVHCIPTPDTVASAIENAIALKQQRAKGTETPAEQEQKAEAIKVTLQEEAKETSASASLPEPPANK